MTKKTPLPFGGGALKSQQDKYIMIDYEKRIKELAERNRLAKTDEERAAVDSEMTALRNENEKAFTEALEGLITTTANEVQEQRMAERLGEITDMMSMAYIAKTYFKKSRSWLAHKLNGNVVNGKPSQFTEDEIKTLRFALNDMASKLSVMSTTL